VAFEAAAQLLHAEADACLDGAEGLVEKDGYLLLGEAAEVSELEGAPLFGGEGGEGAANGGAVFVGFGRGERVGLGRLEDGLGGFGWFAERATFALPAAAAGAELIERAVAADAHEPADEATALGDERLGAAPDADKHVLHGIFGEAGVAEDAVGGGIDEVDLAVVEGSEGVLVALEDGVHERFVRPVGAVDEFVADGANELDGSIDVT
jgi:hypothetical protein